MFPQGDAISPEKAASPVSPEVRRSEGEFKP